MPNEMTREQTWAAIHSERTTLAADLVDLPDDRWAAPSLCAEWSVEQTLAHLTAGAFETRWRWLASVIRARGNFDRHNQRGLTTHLGNTPHATLNSFRNAIPSTTAASGHHWAWLGEIVIHAEDIRRPLGITPSTPPHIAAEVVGHFTVKNFTVKSKTHAAGLHLRATDSTFEHGQGPEVAGPTLSLLMVLSGRPTHLADLHGEGVPRIAAAIA